MLIGRVGADPEIKTLDNGVALATLPLATTEYFKDGDGNKREKTEWHRVVIWRKLAEVVRDYVHKGDLLYLEGKVTYRQYTDKDGNTRFNTEVVCDEMQMLSPKKSNGGHVGHPADDDGLPPSEDLSDSDDLPF